MRLSCIAELPPDLQSAILYRQLQTNGLVYRQGELVETVFFVTQGRVRLDNHVEGLGTVPLYVARPGEWVSEAALFAERYCSDAVAEVASTVALFPKLLLQSALDKNPELAKEYMTLQSRRFNVIRMRMEIRSIRLAKERVLRYLLVSRPPDSPHLWLDRPLKSLADDIGLTHEAFYRTVTKLEREGAIRWSGNTILFPQIK